VILSVANGKPRVCTLKDEHGELALPSGPLDLTQDRTLELATRRRVREQIDLELGYVEQLYTFGDRDRKPTARTEGARVISVAYLALVREHHLESTPRSRVGWTNIYDLLPWEEWLQGRPQMIDRSLLPTIRDWIDAAPNAPLRAERQSRADLTFGGPSPTDTPWDGERVLERYELLYETGLVAERARDSGLSPSASPPTSGHPMAVDHRRICATALGRLRGKIRYRPLVFELLPDRFTLLELQRVVEALAGIPIHKQNFRRLVDRSRLVEGTGSHRARTRGRPAELFRFRRDLLRQRQGPGIGLPRLR
jgi:hypothetical protein